MVNSESATGDDGLFATLVTDEKDLISAVLLVNSKRAFAGPLSSSSFQIYSTIEVENVFSSIEEIKTVFLMPPKTLAGCLFGAKVFACKEAEAAAHQMGKTLIWIDPACLLVGSPMRFILSFPYKAAFRPVHITNVGQPVSEPLSGYWRQIYSATGNRVPNYSLQSFIESEEILPYFNTHCFSLDPSLGLCSKWMATLEQLLTDKTFTLHLSNSLHGIFLFQAVLSAVITANLNQDEICLLPPDYSYPYHLQERIPPDKRVNRLNELTCVVYEEESIHPGNLRGIEVIEPLASWLKEQVSI